MKHRYIPYILLAILPIRAEEVFSLLSPEKQSLFRLQQDIYESENEKLRTNWIAPLNLTGSYSYDKNALGDERSTTKKLSASLSQDIFRSGGITYQIAYADAKKKGETLTLLKEITAQNLQLFTALLNYRKNLYQKEQALRRLKNKEIEIFIKRQLFDAGKVDITELNNALMEQSSELKTLASIDYAIVEQRYEIAKISDINPDMFELPHFILVEQEAYQQRHLDLLSAEANTQTLHNLYNVTTADYLPSVALNGTLGYMNVDPVHREGEYDGHYYSAGFSITLPLVYNASATLQEAKATYLKEAATAADKKRETASDYSQSIARIKSYQETVSLITRNLLLYEDLIGAVQAGVDAGTKTGYDLQTLQNSKAIEEVDIKINEINIQIELAKLHFSLKPSKDFR